MSFTSQLVLIAQRSLAQKMRMPILLLWLGIWAAIPSPLAAVIEPGLAVDTEPSSRLLAAGDRPELKGRSWLGPERPSWFGPEGTALPFRDDSQILDFLRTAAIVSAKPISKGINHSLKVLLEKDGTRAHAVFRQANTGLRTYQPPASSHSAKFRDSCFFEPAAYELARRLGIRRIPPVVKRRYGGRDGTLQIWVENAFDEQARLAQDLRSPHPTHWRRQRIVQQVFDALIYNIDRNQGNMLIDPDWNVWLIDHTRSFVAEPGLKARKKIRWCDRDLWERLQTVDRQAVAADLEPFLTPRELRSLLIRWQRLVETIQGLIAKNGERTVIF